MLRFEVHKRRGSREDGAKLYIYHHVEPCTVVTPHIEYIEILYSMREV